MTEQVREIAIEDLEVGDFNPRRGVGDIAELAASIRERGVLEPILVTPIAGNGHFAIVAGSRRVAASKLAGKATVPAIVRQMTDDEAEATSLIENLHREDLSPLEEAEGYARWLQIKGKAGEKVTHDDLAKAVGKARSTVTNTLRLLKAPSEIKEGLKNGDLTPAHVRVLLKVADPSLMDKVDIYSGQTTVQELEEEVDRVNAEWELTGPKTQEEAKTRLAKAREQFPNADFTWRGDHSIPLDEWLGDPPKKIVDQHIVDALKKHDAACPCRAYELRATVERTWKGRNLNERVEFAVIRVCVDPVGHRKYEKGRLGGKPGRTIARSETSTPKKSAATVAKERERKRREFHESIAGQISGSRSYREGGLPGADVFKKLIAGGYTGDKAARLVLLSYATERVYTSAEMPEIVRGILAMPASKARELVLQRAAKRVQNHVLSIQMQAPFDRRVAKFELLKGFGVKSPEPSRVKAKTKKKAKR